MNNASDSSPDLSWLASRCAALFPSLADLGVSAVASRLQASQAATAELAIAELFENLALNAPVWSPTLDALQLPALGFFPGLGWGVITEMTARGDWRFECRDGIHTVDAMPYRQDARTKFAAILPKLNRQGSTAPTAESMFRRSLAQAWPLFAVAALAALCANVLAVAGSLYSMQVYDRVIPTQGISTLVVLTVGVILAGLIELVIKLIRSRLMEQAMKHIDLSVSQEIFERVTRIRMDQFPRSVGNLSAQLRSYETIRAFLASMTMFVAADAPFAILFLLFIAVIGGPEMAAVPVFFAFVALLVGLYARHRIARHAARGITVANRKFGLLVETVERAECLKAYGGRRRQSALWRALNAAAVEEDAHVRHHSEQATYLAAFIQQLSYVAIVGLVLTWPALLAG